ncbi:Nucleoside diphosphate kinase [Clostridiaceae bacterium JG1575]|nr:Nucleoside diphosphate kinase [Clostridiaceae bacterium JG1575]
MEQSLILIKPDAVTHHLIGAIIGRYEEEGLTVSALQMLRPTQELAVAHYAEHQGKPFYEALLSFITSGDVVALILSGEDAIARVRLLNGATDPQKADAGTLRALYGEDPMHNVVHASNSSANAQREIALWFPKSETSHVPSEG